MDEIAKKNLALLSLKFCASLVILVAVFGFGTGLYFMFEITWWEAGIYSVIFCTVLYFLEKENGIPQGPIDTIKQPFYRR